MKRPDRDRFADDFFRFLEVERNASPRTLINYRHALAELRKTPNLPAWKELTADHFRRYLFDCGKRGIARPTIRLHFAALRTFYKFLTERHGLKDNPLKEVQLPKLEKKLPIVLTQKQIDELLTAPLRVPKSGRAPVWMPARDAAILELFYSSGLRLAELVALDVSGVDVYSESVRVLGKGRRGADRARGLRRRWRSIQYRQRLASTWGRCSSTSTAAYRGKPMWLVLKRYLPHTKASR